MRSIVSSQAGSRGEIVAHRLVLAGQRPKLVDPVRVGQEAQVEHQVGGARNAAGEGEGGDGQDRLVGIAAVAPAKLVAQLGGRQVGGVDARCRRRSRSGAVSARSRAMPSSAGRSGASGWRRRVSS